MQTQSLKPVSRKTAAAVCLFFAALWLVGFCTVRDYSAPFDEPWEMNTLCENLKEYALRWEGEQGTSFFATLSCARISESTERDHGMCAYYPLAPWLPALSANMRDFSYGWSLLTWSWFWLGCIALYGFLRELGASAPLACCGTLLLYLSPRFFAEGHYNNKDVVLLCLALACLWQGARLLRKPSLPRGLWFSLFGAMATNTKVAGALPWALMGLATAIFLTLERRWNRRMAGVAAVTMLSYLGFYALLTPALWSGPVAYLHYLIGSATRFTRNAGNVIFRGADFYDVLGETPLPRYYVPYYMLVTIPLYTLLLFGGGQLAAFRSFLAHGKPIPGECPSLTAHKKTGTKKNPPQALRQKLLLAVATLMWLLPVAGAVALRPVLYNGWRHFYFVYSGLTILAGYGLCRAAAWAKQKTLRKCLCAAALAACLGLTGAGVALNHPFQFAYFNPLQPRDSQYTMDLDYWHAGAAGAFRRLYGLYQDREGPLRVGCYFNDLTIGTYKLPEEMARRIVVTTARDEEFLYYNSTYAHNYWVQEPPEGYRELFRCQSYGNTFGVMYQREDSPAPSR